MRRLLDEGRGQECLPLTKLPHPLTEKAAELFVWGSDGYIKERISEAADHVLLWKIEYGQWRAAVLEDEALEVYWLCAAGLAKGGHRDRADFYKTLGRKLASAGHEWLLPTEEDRRLLKVERATRILGAWELAIQARVYEALSRCLDSRAACRFTVSHPVSTTELAELELEVCFDDEAEMVDVFLSVSPAPLTGANLWWRCVLIAMAAIEPEEQAWDGSGVDPVVYSVLCESSKLYTRCSTLGSLVQAEELATLEPGRVAHHTPRAHLTEHTVNGTAARALCGVHFVPRQDFAGLEECRECNAELERLGN